MRQKFLLVRLVGLLLVAAPALAQTPAPPTAAVGPAYTDPRFPGGPDSLRALVYRSVRAAGPAPAGWLMLHFELKDGSQPQRFELLTPPQPVSPELARAAATASAYLQAHMPAWLPGAPDPQAKPGELPKVSLRLDFSAAPADQPYYYPDQGPVFPDFAALLRAQRNANYDRLLNEPSWRASLDVFPKNLATYLQLQVRYPPQALRFRQQGQVFAYFEVAENGAVEHAEIVGTAGQALDAEVRRVLKLLPNATAPAQLQGRPVCVFYVLPITFKIV